MTRDWLFVGSTPENMPPEQRDAFEAGRRSGIMESADCVDSLRQERVHEIFRDSGLHSAFHGECDDDGWADLSDDLRRRYRSIATHLRTKA